MTIFTHAGTQTELNNFAMTMRESYDVQVRGVLDTERKESQDVEILGGALVWPSDGLEVQGRREASSGVAARTRAVSSSAVRTEEMDPKEDDDTV